MSVKGRVPQVSCWAGAAPREPAPHGSFRFSAVQPPRRSVGQEECVHAEARRAAEDATALSLKITRPVLSWGGAADPSCPGAGSDRGCLKAQVDSSSSRRGQGRGRSV